MAGILGPSRDLDQGVIAGEQNPLPLIDLVVVEFFIHFAANRGQPQDLQSCRRC